METERWIQILTRPDSDEYLPSNLELTLILETYAVITSSGENVIYVRHACCRTRGISFIPLRSE